MEDQDQLGDPEESRSEPLILCIMNCMVEVRIRPHNNDPNPGKFLGTRLLSSEKNSGYAIHSCYMISR